MQQAAKPSFVELGEWLKLFAIIVTANIYAILMFFFVALLLNI